MKTILIGAILVILAVIAIVVTGEAQTQAQFDWASLGAVSSL